MINPGTETVLAEMLTENTGRSMCDSGGAYGRNWERNQGRDFASEPVVTFDPTWSREGEEFRPDVTLNVYHWLAEKLTYDEDLDKAYQAFADARRADEYEMRIMEEFVVSLNASGIYGDGDPVTVNTYNGECLLSQILQYVFFTHEDESYVLLQIHGGCDARGGYTDARVFRAGEEIFYNAHATIFADGEGAFNTLPHWYTDDSYNYYPEGADRMLAEYKVSYDPAHKGDGVHVYIDEDNKAAYCPISGFPLAASAH